jgi:hypothetical protein
VSKVLLRTPAPIEVAFGEHWSLVDECDRVIHAVECPPALHLVRLMAEEGSDPHEPLAAVCGHTSLPLWWNVVLDGRRADLIPWPPRVASLNLLGYSRCSDCWNLTGRKRPHADWPAA